jgi:hypothetical protein
MLLRSAMVLSSGRVAQDMEAGSSSFPGVGVAGRQPIRRLRLQTARASRPSPEPGVHVSLCRAALGILRKTNGSLKNPGSASLVKSSRYRSDCNDFRNQTTL